MATTAWGSGLSADEQLSFAGHSELTATRIASSALLLDWVRFTGDFCRYWQFDEGSGTTIYDSSPYHANGVITNAQWVTVNPWMGAAHWKPTWGNYAWLPSAPGPPSLQYFTLECWGNVFADTQERILICQYGAPYTPFIRFNHDSVAGQIYFRTNSTNVIASPGSVTSAWHHLAFVCAPDNLRIYVDGAQVAMSSTAPGAQDGWGTMIIGRNATNATRFWANDLDEFVVYPSVKYTSDFSPHRYDQGYAVLTKTAESAPRKVTALDWTGTFGASYGSVYRVQVNTGSDVSPTWTTVGGDNPTSPITGLDLTVQAGVTRWVRAYLNPRADTLQSETPILSALRITHNAAGGGAPRIYAPQRFGPSLIPLGGLL